MISELRQIRHRWPVIITIIVIGTGLHLAVAVGGAVWGIYKTEPGKGIAKAGVSNLHQGDERWGVGVYESPAFVRVHAWVGGTFPKVPCYIPRFALDVVALSKRIGGEPFTIIRVGWPFSSFEAMATVDFTGPSGRQTRALRGYLVGTAASRSWDDRLLPYGPLPAGILGNTLFWCLVAGGILGVWRWCRDRLRLRKGRCPQCAHVLCTHEEQPEQWCSECGWGTSPAGAPPLGSETPREG